MPTDRSKNRPNQQTPMSHALLLRLHALPRLVVPAIAVVLALVGLMARPTFAVPALLVLFAFLCWLASLTWHQLDRRGAAAARTGDRRARWAAPRQGGRTSRTGV